MMENCPYSLYDKTILVTGMSTEIGRTIAIECSKMGAKVVLADDDLTQLQETMSKLDGDGHTLINCDFCDEDSLNELVSKCPNINGWCNAYVSNKTLLLKFVNSSSLNESTLVNINMPVLLLQKLVKQKKLQKHSSVVFVASVSGVYTVHYADSINALSSGAISAFTKGSALDLAASGIRVNSLNLSVIETEDMLKSSILTDEELDEKRNYFPLKRFGTPQDVAFSAIYMLSDASSWITGVHLPIDGGYTLL